uniref:Uncharacterized protein n=1 Tax=Chlamydomonas euryale TaxID=1486919 RepID=A0A7R9W0K5_9CHLO|mmetsp:Transcript_8820/g.26781  ORF Transcript_8820/g.26781 Transcript_8820/m.26781 type:complete len:226 (+) Transcript_8820:622-1299(+)
MPTTESAIAFEDAAAWIKDGSIEALARLQRSREGLTKYLAFKQQVVSEWDSVLDQLTARMFDCDITLTEGGKKKAAVKADVLTAPQPTIVFQQNDFPYNFEAGVTHYVLWSSKPLSPDQINAQIEKHMPGQETVMFVNPPVLQSIPAVRTSMLSTCRLNAACLWLAACVLPACCLPAYGALHACCLPVACCLHAACLWRAACVLPASHTPVILPCARPTNTLWAS